METENRAVVARAGEGGGNMELLFGVSDWQDEKVLEIGCVTVRIDLTLQNHTLKNG